MITETCKKVIIEENMRKVVIKLSYKSVRQKNPQSLAKLCG